MASINDLSPEDIKNILGLLAQGELQHRIAAKYDLNQGRISELKKGKWGPKVLTGGDRG